MLASVSRRCIGNIFHQHGCVVIKQSINQKVSHSFRNPFAFQKPERDEWGSGTEALECALQLEKSVNQSLLDLHKLCSDHNDPHVST